MNKDTGFIKEEKDLTEDERKSGRWVEMKGMGRVRLLNAKPLTKSELRREEYMERVRAKERTVRAELEVGK